MTIGGQLLAIAPNPSVDRLLEVETFRRGEIQRPVAVTVVPGGKGFNVARSAAALGTPVVALGLLGGYAGRWIEAALALEGVAVIGVPRAGETRTCTSILDRADGSLTELYEAGEPIALGEWDRLLAAVDASLAGGEVGLATVSGSLPPGAPDDGLARIVEIARSYGARVVVDGHGPALVRALTAGPWFVKVNLAEACAALGAGLAGSSTSLAPAELVSAASGAIGGLVRAGVERAVVTIGERGAVARLEDGSLIHVRPPAIGAYPVGSGDAFLGGLSAATLEGQDVRGAVVRGTAAAAASSLVPGAGRLVAADVERLLDAVSVERVT